MNRSRRQPESHAPDPSPEAVQASSASASETTRSPEPSREQTSLGFSVEKRLLKAINATLGESLQILLDDIYLRAFEGEGASVSTRGTIQHVADHNKVYIMDYEVHISYRSVTEETQTEGKREEGRGKR